ncbi:MAG: 50S ribosomal protein L35 [Rhodospirillales bacterium]|nr:50S ribosomal protein L35 [Rhodospirillales bacterium]
MPKMKTKSGAKKRFRITGKGRIKFKQAKTSHMMMNKPKSMKRKARGEQILNDSDAKLILDNFFPYGRGRKKSRPSVSTSIVKGGA